MPALNLSAQTRVPLTRQQAEMQDSADIDVPLSPVADITGDTAPV
jgi:hypothetical protein